MLKDLPAYCMIKIAAENQRVPVKCPTSQNYITMPNKQYTCSIYAVDD